ncbi:hypothetical protein [Enterococcus faecium]|uniref:hypothetical protein n=1 Tax=Enterococcus faecium TaxID=1352 RepID=UPI00093C55C8|nr:hypothetical protein [Enterococcus faecium]PHL10689.1 hypothetical protein CQR41_04860 [Enterococcus faecium]
MFLNYDEGLVEDYIDKNIVQPVLKLIEQTIEDAGKDPSEWDFLNLSISLDDTELKYINLYGENKFYFRFMAENIHVYIHNKELYITKKRKSGIQLSDYLNEENMELTTNQISSFLEQYFREEE